MSRRKIAATLSAAPLRRWVVLLAVGAAAVFLPERTGGQGPQRETRCPTPRVTSLPAITSRVASTSSQRMRWAGS